MIRHSVTGARARRGRPLRFEPLEDRRVLAVVVVDTLEDVVDLGDGKTSLREAIFATNIVPGADEIRFDPALFAAGPATLRLTQGELVISDSLTITGPGPQWLTIDASGSDPTPDIKNGDGGRVFRITDGSTSLLDVAIEGLQLTGGDVAPTTAKVGGGAILNYENLTLAHVVIADNRALAGGGVYHREGSLTVAHSTFVRNAATDRGGGLFAFGVPASQISVSHSEFSDNSATRGGGASISGGTVLLEQLLVDNNLATFAGGGISCEITSLTVLGGTFSNNRAGIRSTGTGGALAISIDPVSSPGTQAILVGVTIRDNMAGDPGFASGFGGGLFFTELRPGPVSQVTALEIRSSTIVGNRANIGGGGIYATGGRAVQISDSTISGNFAVSPTGGQTGGGGALFLQVAEATMHRVTIAGNESSASGGGIRAAGGVIRIADSIILGNAALAAFANGGGASLSVTAGTLERTVVANNHAGRVGGGLALSYVQLVPGVSIQAFSVLHSVIADNSAVQSGGGIAAPGALF